MDNDISIIKRGLMKLLETNRHTDVIEGIEALIDIKIAMVLEEISKRLEQKLK